MTNFIFSRANPTTKKLANQTVDILMMKLEIIQKQLRWLRTDNHEMSLKLEKLLIDKHLQMQVDNYFEDDSKITPEDSQDLD